MKSVTVTRLLLRWGCWKSNKNKESQLYERGRDRQHRQVVNNFKCIDVAGGRVLSASHSQTSISYNSPAAFQSVFWLSLLPSSLPYICMHVLAVFQMPFNLTGLQIFVINSFSYDLLVYRVHCLNLTTKISFSVILFHSVWFKMC